MVWRYIHLASHFKTILPCQRRVDQLDLVKLVSKGLRVFEHMRPLARPIVDSLGVMVRSRGERALCCRSGSWP